jgi:hypothetical protein
MKVRFFLLLGILFVSCCKNTDRKSDEKIPLVVITDLYHPHQDPGDNFDLINCFALPDVDLREAGIVQAIAYFSLTVFSFHASSELRIAFPPSRVNAT